MTPLPEVLIVSYRRADLLERCLTSVAEHLPGAVVRIWDNASDGTDEIRQLATRWDHVQWTFHPDNVGFARAVNHLMASVDGSQALLLNPDSTLLGDLAGCREALARDPEVAAAAPWIHEDHQRHPWDNAHREPSLVRQLVSYAGYENRLARLPWLSLLYREQPHNVTGYLTGACLLISTSAWASVGPMDERYFLYAEEADWCARARQRGYRLVAVPEPGVRHRAGGTVSDAPTQSSLSARLLRSGQIRYLTDHHGPLAGRAYDKATRAIDRLQPSKRRAVAAAKRADREGQGHEPAVLVVSAMYPTDEDAVRGIAVRREVDRLRARGTSVTVIGKSPGWRGYLAQAIETRRFVRSVDLIHAHYGTSGFVAALVAPRTPLIVTMHGSDVALGLRPRLNKYWIQYILSIIGALRAAAIVVQDPTMATQIPGRMRGKVVILGQAVDVPPYGDRERHGILFLSDRSRPVKRFFLAEQAVAELHPPQLLDSLDRHSVEGIPDAMSVARVGLLTSEREGMPIAVKEALACGLRVVSVDLPALRPLAAACDGAIVLVPHEPAALATALAATLARDPLTRDEHAGVVRVLRDRLWTEPERTTALSDIYLRVANNT